MLLLVLGMLMPVLLCCLCRKFNALVPKPATDSSKPVGQKGTMLQVKGGGVLLDWQPARCDSLSSTAW
jgi:hypothetical protein